MFSIETAAAPDVPDDVAAVLHDQFTLGDAGQMAAVFRSCRRGRGGWTGRAVIVRDTNETIVGWGLRWKAFEDSTRWALFLFVDPARRREGIGTLIAGEATRRVRQPVKGFVWNDESANFYASAPHPHVFPQETRSAA